MRSIIIIFLLLGTFFSENGVAQDTIKLNPALPGVKIPSNFTGLAYESNALHFDSLKPGNHTLIQYFKTAGIKVFRLGGNSVENYIYSPTAHGYIRDTVTNTELDSLFGFAESVGCKILLGMNFGGNFNPSLAAEEASYVMLHYSSQLLAFEIGNEPNLYYRNDLRSPAYTYDSFQLQFLQYVDSIRKYNPDAPVSGPASARLQAALYTNPFAHNMRGVINLLTQHNYSIPLNGGTSSTQIDSLLSRNTMDSIKYTCDTLVMRADSDSVAFQMDECNAMYPEGQWGVNNSLGASLWALDYMYTLAKAGVSGVNFHTTYSTPATIINDTLHVYSACAIYYGILAFQLGCHGSFIPDNFIGTAKNLSIYPVIDSVQNIYVTLINKDTLNPVSIELYADSTVYTTGQMVSLTASTISDTFGITLGESSVTAGGTWTPGLWTTLTSSHGYFPFIIPAATAIIAELNAPVVTANCILNNQSSFSLFPNPSNGIFTLESTNVNQRFSLEIYNVPGERVYTNSISPSQTYDAKIEINLASLANGVYLYEITDEKGNSISNGKFIIQK
jgi:Secretion system C-terminal sorting domain/Glycosyl hydrolase family 79, N-terminal domain